MIYRLSKLLILAAAASWTAAAAAFDREGLIVPYAEDHFRDIASMRYDRSPFYRAIERASDSITLHIPADWNGKRIVVGVGYPSDTFHLPDLTINGIDPGPAYRPLQWEVTHLLPLRGERTVKLRGLGKKERRVYAYATPQEVWVDRYHLTSALDSTDLTTGLFDMEIELGGVRKTNPLIAVEYMLFDASRHQVAAGRADASPHLRFRARIPDIHPWSTDDPYRYMLAIIIRNDRTGHHIMTVGSPMRFANYTARSGEGPMLNSVPMGPLSLAALDSIPVDLESREALVASLRAAGANAVIAPAGVDPDIDWRNFCADRGLLCYADGSLDPMVLFAADPADAEHPQLPGGFDRMAERYTRVRTELSDTASLTIAARTRSPFAPLSDFALDYELISPLGIRLTSGSDIVVSGGARETVLIPLLPAIPDGTPVPVIPDDVSEAYLNVSWRPLRPMAGAVEGMPTSRKQFVIGRYTGLEELDLMKLKHKGTTWKTSGLDFTLSPVSGLPISLLIGGKQMLDSPVSATIDGMSARVIPTSTVYNKATKMVRVCADLQNPVTDAPIGKTVIEYSVSRDRTLDISIREAPAGFALSFPAPSDRIYLGRGPGHSPVNDSHPARIALYHAKAPATNMSESHAETRSVTLINPGLTIRFDRPAELVLSKNRASVNAEASTLRLSAAVR